MAAAAPALPPENATYVAPVPTTADATAATLPPLDQLLAPIALYPDPLVSLILPASTYPDQVQAAAAFVQGGGDPAQAGAMGWDPSVQGLAYYPTVLAWMAGNQAWTQQLGGAFAGEPAAVMDAIQDLRRRAEAAGTLVTNDQQEVVDDQGEVEIVPAQANEIYVPEYDPAVVYVEQPPGFYVGSLFAWGQPYPAGAWLAFDFDWRRHAVWQGDWYQYRMQHGGWAHPVDFAQARVNVGGSPYSNWRPPHNAPPPPPGARPAFAQPRVMTGAPQPPAGAVRVNAILGARGEHPIPARPAVPHANPSEARSEPPAPNPARAGPPPTEAPRLYQAPREPGGLPPERANQTTYRPESGPNGAEHGRPMESPRPDNAAPRKPAPKSKEDETKEREEQQREPRP